MKIHLKCCCFVAWLFTATLLQAQELPPEDKSNVNLQSANGNSFLQDEDNPSLGYWVANRAISPSYEFFSLEPMDRETKDNFEEDLNVLDYLIRKSLPGAKTRAALGVQVNVYNSKPSVKVIDGFGIIMNYEVGMALAPVKKANDESAGNNNEEKTDWEKAKSELRNSSGSLSNIFIDRSGNRITSTRNGLLANRSLPAYDEELVEELKKDLKDALANAINVDQLGKGDQVLVTLKGASWHDGEQWKQTVLSMRVSMSDFSSSKEIDLDKIETNAAVVENEQANGRFLGSYNTR